MTALRASLKTLANVYVEVKRLGTQVSLPDKMMTRDEVYDLIGYYSYEGLDSKSAKLAAEILSKSVSKRERMYHDWLLAIKSMR
jgi:methylisocitrate lyase